MTGRLSLDGILRLGGWALVIASALFLVAVGYRHWSELSAIALSPVQWAAIGGLVLAYGAGLLLTGLVWHAMLVFVGAAPQDLHHSMRAHTSAQLAKYVPGNVFHFVGRHMIHRAAGMDDKRLALAAFFENLVLLVCAACVSLLCLALSNAGGRVSDFAGFGAAGLFVALVVLAIILKATGRRIGALAAGLLSGLCFFVLMAGTLAAIAMMLGTGFAWEICGGGVAAWIAGFVTPGSPGGLGVREAAMVLLGGRAAAPDVLLMTALLFRVVTFGGDIVCAISGRMLFRERPGMIPTRV